MVIAVLTLFGWLLAIIGLWLFIRRKAAALTLPLRCGVHALGWALTIAPSALVAHGGAVAIAIPAPASLIVLIELGGVIERRGFDELSLTMLMICAFSMLVVWAFASVILVAWAKRKAARK